MTNWNAIIESTKNVLENTCSEYLNTELKYAENLIMSDGLAASVYNGTYFIRLKNIPNMSDTVNRRFSPLYTVGIELCYQISAGDSVASYNNAVEDIEVIIRERLIETSWSDYQNNIQYITVSSVEEPKFILKGEIFMIIPVNFDFTMISTY